jgi:hypothetical protein
MNDPVIRLESLRQQVQVFNEYYLSDYDEQVNAAVEAGQP